MRFSKRRVAVGVAIVALLAYGAWLVGTPSGCIYSVPDEARELLACWKITSSTDERYPAGESLCLHPDRVVVRAGDGAVSDGWRVTWSRDEAAWRMTVPRDLTEGFDVHFVTAAGDGGGYSFRSGAGWVV